MRDTFLAGYGLLMGVGCLVLVALWCGVSIRDQIRARQLDRDKRNQALRLLKIPGYPLPPERPLARLQRERHQMPRKSER